MAAPKDYARDANGTRFVPGGINTVLSLDSLPPNRYAYLRNVRGYLQNQIISRSTESAPVVAGLPNPIHSLKILNDTTTGTPAPYYVRIIGAAGSMYVNALNVARGLSTAPISMCPFRPNASVRPWVYCGDSSQLVTIDTKFLINNTPTTYPATLSPTSYCTGQIKAQSDGLIFKTGIEEPQIAPTVTTQDYITSGTDVLHANTIPWTNVGAKNAGIYNYRMLDSSPVITDPVIITGGAATLIAGAKIILNISGAANVNGGIGVGASTPGPTSARYPGSTSGISGSPTIVIAAFTDSSGNVIAPGGSPPAVYFVGAGISAPLIVPPGATQLHVGINSSSDSTSPNWYHLNSGSFSIDWSVTISAIATVISTVGQVTAYVWGTPPPTGGGSPHSGPVGSYIWKNAGDVGSGIPRSLTSPVPDVSPTNNSWKMQALPQLGGTQVVNWDTLNPDGSIFSTIPLFNPALESEGFQDFNCCIVGQLFVPAGGTYNFTLQYKDQILFGVDGGATAVVSSGAPSAGVPAPYGQKITVIEGIPLLFVSVATGQTGNPAQTTNLAVTFPGTGVYKIEIDWDYWDKHQATMIMQCASTSSTSPTIPPLPFGVRTAVQYRYVYRSSATGALSNPSPESPLQQTPVLANLVTSIYSTDPQVDKVDYYRSDSGLINFTYVATGPNDGLGGTIDGVIYNTPIEDELTDIEVAANPILQFDNFEPFPVTDLPHKGWINVSGGVITWVNGLTIGKTTAGDLFDIRWLPGTLIKIGSPTSVTYVFISRPTSTTSVTIPGVPDGTNLVYEIPEPTLAAQPLPYLWGPTDNIAYMFACGDKMNPGTLYFTKGNNPDSAPETNQISVTSPSEPLINGVTTAAMGMVWTTERRFLIYPTFETALATVSGVAGTPFNVVEATGSRGLYISRCLCTDGGLQAFFRAKDGIYTTSFGGQDENITGDIYNLFPREGVIPEPITIAGHTIFPPDDTRPDSQKLSWSKTVLFYDYQDVNGDYRTLVFDTLAKGWSVDEGQFPFTVHAWEEGPNTDTVMVGCSDGTVRLLGSGNPEVETSVVIPGSQNGGDARAFKRAGDVFIKALATATNPIATVLYANRYTQTLAGFSPTSLVGTGSLLPYIIDFTSGFGDDLIDLGIAFTWPVASGDLLDLWSPTLLPLPESTQDRPTDWDDAGFVGTKFVQGLLLEANSFNVPKQVTVQRSDDNSILTPNESPIIFNGQSIRPLTFTPPFLAHSMRIVTTDGVLWNMWGIKWVFEPYPESTVEWQSEFTSHGMMGWQHLREMNLAYSSTTPLTLTLVFQAGPTDLLPTIVLTIPSSGGIQTKRKTTIPANKYKLISYRLSSTEPFFLFKQRCEAKVKWWGSSDVYSIITPFGGPEQLGAEV